MNAESFARLNHQVPLAAGSNGQQVDQASVRNRLLAGLSPGDFSLLRPQLEAIVLPAGTRLVAADMPIEHAYFLEEGIASIVASTNHGRRIEVGIVGREGMSGVPVLLSSSRSPHETFVQTKGVALRIKPADLRRAAEASPSLHGHLLRYVQTLVVQMCHTALANGCHLLEERLARWLVMCHDRVDGDELSTTHEFLSVMLGVRRAGVSERLQTLEDDGLVSTKRGQVTVLDRARLEDAAGDG